MGSPNFGTGFFERHQRKLLSFANSRAGRWFFRLKEVGISSDFRVMEIAPNYVSGNWRLDMEKQQVVKETHFFVTPRFSDRMRNVYRKASRLIPQAVAWKLMQPLAGVTGSLAFLPLLALTTSTFYPDPNPETTCMDGWVDFYGVAAFSVIRGAATGTNTDGGGGGEAYVQCGYFGSGDYTIRRMFFLFDTSAISSDTVSSGTLSLYGVAGTSNTNSYTLDIVASSPASNTALTTADYDQVGTTVFSDMAIGSWNTSAYNDFSLNASGIAAIVNGISKFAMRMSGDTDNSAPTGNNSAQMRLAETAVTSNDPKLVVIHASAGFRSMGGGVSYMGSLPSV